MLSDTAIQELLRGAVRRRAGHALLVAAQDIQAACIPPMSMDEIDAAVRAVHDTKIGVSALIWGGKPFALQRGARGLS